MSAIEAPDIEARERAKYEAIWQHQPYRKIAPGEHHVAAAIRELKIGPLDRVVDFGCGTGRAALRFAAKGRPVTAVDIARNCLDPEAERASHDGRIDFRLGCLWRLPWDVTGDYGFCTDVMEHVPPEKVPAVLRGIASAVTKGAYFQIATTHDRMGRLIGQTLHLTVQPAQWWRERLEGHWNHVEMREDRGNAVVFICQ